MRFWTPYRAQNQAQIARATNPQVAQAPTPSGSWLAYGLALIAACLLIFSAGAQNVAYGWQLGLAHGQFRAVVLALASAGATLLAPICFLAVARCVRGRKFGMSIVALALGCLAFQYSATCSLGFIAGSRDIGISERLAASDSLSDRQALRHAALAELGTLKGQRADVVERRSELTALLAKLIDAKTGERLPVKPDSQAAGVAFTLSALGWRVSEADVGQWLNVGMVMFLELAAALSLTVAAALYPATRAIAAEAPRTREAPAPGRDSPKPADRAVRASGASPRPSDRDGADDPPAPPKGKPGRRATVLPAQAVERLRKAGGEMQGSLTGIGRLIGSKSKTTTHRLLHQLAASGMVRLASGPNGVRIALA